MWNLSNSEAMRCKACGAKFRDNYRYCPRCGHEVEPDERQSSGGRSYIGLIITMAVVIIAAMVGATVWLVSTHERDESVRVESERLTDSLRREEALQVRRMQHRRDSMRHVNDSIANAREVMARFVVPGDLLTAAEGGGAMLSEPDDMITGLREKGYVTLRQEGVARDDDGAAREVPAVMAVNATLHGERPVKTADFYSVVTVFGRSRRVEVLFCSEEGADEFWRGLRVSGMADAEGGTLVATGRDAIMLGAERTGPCKVVIKEL